MAWLKSLLIALQNSSVDHDNLINISPGVRTVGNVTVGLGAWIGIGSVVSNNVSICGDCKLGAGSVAVKDITEPGTYVGVPARKIG